MSSKANRRAKSPASLGPLFPAPDLPKALVERPRLYGLLDVASDLPLTMLVAPAGTGKTVLLSGWVRSTGPAAASKVRWIPSHEHTNLEDQVEATRSGIRPATVIVDDAHQLTASQLRWLNRILDTDPTSVRLVLATRRDLALPAVALDLQGLATSFRARELRFNDDEASELIRAHAISIAQSDMEILRDKTGGWAAALVLGARAMDRDSGDGTLSAAVRTDQPVLDFLLGDAFTALSKPVRQILLSTSNESIVTSEQAAILSGNPDAGDLLGELASEGLLVTAYSHGDTQDVIYRYHPLLIELLRRRVVKSETDAGVLAEAHRRAALHYRARGESSAALQQAVAGRDEELICRLLVDLGPTLLWAGRADVVEASFAGLPADVLDRFPHLLGVAGLHRRSTGDIAGAVTLTNRANAAVSQIFSDAAGARSPMDDALRADAMLLRLWQARHGWQDSESALARAHEMLACLHGSEVPAGHALDLELSPERLAWLMVELAVVEIWVGDLTSAKVHIDEALVSARQVKNARLIAAALAHRSFVQLVRGEIQNADETALDALRHADLAGSAAEPLHDRARLVLAWSAYYRCDLELAEERLSALDPKLSARSDVVIGTYISMLRASLMLEANRLDEARRELSDAPEAPGTLPPFLIRATAVMRWHCAMLAGDGVTVAQQAELLATAGFTVEVALLAALSDSVSGDSDKAIVEIEHLVEELGATDPVLAAAAAAARVALLLRTGDKRSARRAITDVLNRVAPQRTVQVLTVGAWAEPAFFDLLVEETARRDAHPYAAAALQALSRHRVSAGELDARGVLSPPRPEADGGADRLRSGLRQDQVPPRQRSSEVSIEGFPVALTARESDVLQQLALGSSYTEIGHALYITENTVKTHLASLYRKLGVDKRSAALRVSRELGLL